MALRVLHLPNAFLPYRTGGREVYAYALAAALQNTGAENHIVFHQDPDLKEPIGEYDYLGLPVTVLPQIPGFNNAASRYTRTFGEVPGFEEYLNKLKPHIIHFHDQNGGASLSHLRVARKLGIKTIVTYHSPGQSCSQYELLFRRRTVCDGKLLVGRCTSCRLSIAGLPDPVADVVARIPFSPKSLMEKNDKVSRLLGARGKTKAFIDSYYEFVELADRVHVHANWVKELLLRNNIAANKIVFARTGATAKFNVPVKKTYTNDQPLRLVFIGRCDPIKGISALIDAVKQLPTDAKVVVDFYGPYWSDAFGQEMLNKIGNDPRFNMPVLVPNHELQDKLKSADAVVIPSTWLETGPLTVFDALCAGVPVIGSNLGGIAELINDNVNGLLFEPGNAGQLSAIISRLIDDREIINKLKSTIKPPRTMDDLASDMKSIYNSII